MHILVWFSPTVVDFHHSWGLQMFAYHVPVSFLLGIFFLLAVFWTFGYCKVERSDSRGALTGRSLSISSTPLLPHVLLGFQVSCLFCWWWSMCVACSICLWFTFPHKLESGSFLLPVFEGIYPLFYVQFAFTRENVLMPETAVFTSGLLIVPPYSLVLC